MVVIRKCDACARTYDAKTVRSRFCSDACRVRRSRAGRLAPGDDCDNPLVKATRDELLAAGTLDTVLGQLALTLVSCLAAVQTTAGVAALSRELRTVTAAALGRAPGARNGAGDQIDEIKQRRDAKRGISS